MPGVVAMSMYGKIVVAFLVLAFAGFVIGTVVLVFVSCSSGGYVPPA